MDHPDEAAITRLGVMGGTFDPIHLGHLIVASEVRHALELDRIVFMPAARPWQKAIYSNAEHRLVMTALAAAHNKRFAVSRLELDREGATYTVETMTALREFYGPAVKLFFILGADAAAKLDSWVRIEGLREVAELVVVGRPGHTVGDGPTPDSWPVMHRVDVPAIDISSTDLRRRLRRGEPIDFMVTDEVASYIRENGLYVGEEPVDAA
ncbi:MAG: nicotinate-nucleotide adenylyltransferase [Actinobacteria bacterium]|nr:nicotinate-nucleotide adenylyltransferase [Actinomycetota bacterium]